MSVCLPPARQQHSRRLAHKGAEPFEKPQKDHPNIALSSSFLRGCPSQTPPHPRRHPRQAAAPHPEEDATQAARLGKSIYRHSGLLEAEI